jgi:hypothetical protein
VNYLFILKGLLFIKEMNSLLAMGHDDGGWVGFALNPPLQTMDNPSIMVGNFKVNMFFTMTCWRCFYM